MRNKLLLCMATAGALLLSSCKKTESTVKSTSPGASDKKENWITGQTIVNGTYKISNVSSGFAASYVPNGANPQLMVQNTYSDLNNNQRWTITAIDATYYKIINVTLGKALSAYNTSTGWQLELRPYTGTDDKQKWKIEYVTAGGGASAGYRMIAKASLGLSAAASSNSAGVSIINSTTATTNLQRWNFAMVAYQDDEVTNYFKRTTGSQAFDGNFSVPLDNGKVMWFTNDVFYNQLSGGMLPCLFNNNNSVLVQNSPTNWNISSTVNKLALAGNPNLPVNSPGLFWKLNSPDYMWPGAGVQIGTKVYTYCNEIHNVVGGFNVVGAYLANIDTVTKQVNYTNLNYSSPTGLNGINFGIGMVKVGTTVYVYGYKPAALGVDVYVAKFNTATPTSWSFFQGGVTWGAASGAVSIGQGASAGSYVAQINGKYVMIGTAFTTACDQNTNIFSSFATSPTGPFSALQPFYSIPDRSAGHSPYFYAAIIHPQATVAGSNEFLFTYCINYYEPCVTRCVGGQQDPNGYRPRGVRVPYSVVAPSL